MPRPRKLPERARVVIVGGGVGGTSIAYHLAQLGERDVVLVDRAELTSGSTFHSAGLVGQLRGSVSLTRMMMDSVGLYRRLGDACGWIECGGLRLACTPEREEELHRSQLDFDYAGYATEHFQRLERAAADPRIEEWLALAAAA